jgi:flagellar basal-body rod modification protein FlgD
MATTEVNNSAISAQASGALNNATNASSLKQSENPSKAETDGTKLAENFDDFLLLLTTQLKNQDPTDPLDTNEFTQQLVSFAGVEQQVNTNKNLEKLIGSSVSAGVQQGLGYIGKTVQATGDKGVLEDGKAYFAYELPSDVSEANISILDKAGKVVFSGKGNTNAGKTVAFWDGKNSINNNQMPDGTYQLIVTAKGFKNEEVKAKTYTTGRVSSVETNKDGEVVLSVGTAKVKVNEVISVSEPPTSVKVAANNAQSNQQNNQQ